MKRSFVLMRLCLVLSINYSVHSQTKFEKFSQPAAFDDRYFHRDSIQNKVNPDLAKGMQATVVVHFEDPNFEQIIRGVLRKPNGDVTDLDMMTLERSFISRKNILSISGLEYAINLYEFWMEVMFQIFLP